MDKASAIVRGDKIIVSVTPPRITKKKKKRSVHQDRLPNSISRSRRNILKLAENNDWTYFITLTFQPKYVRKDSESEAAVHKVAAFFSELKKMNGCNDLRWLLVPEPHNDKRRTLHIHGLLGDVPEFLLKKWDMKKKPAYVRSELKCGNEIYTFPKYQQEFGFCIVEKIKNEEAVKTYITKSLADASIFRKSKKALYFHSRNLSAGEEIAKGYLCTNAFDQLSKLSYAKYAHRCEKDGPCFGKSFILLNNFENCSKVKQLIQTADDTIAALPNPA